MPELIYKYRPLLGETFLRPLAQCVVTNTRNSVFHAELAVVDTGATQTSICSKFMELLEIDPDTLEEDVVEGIGGRCRAWICDYIQISFLRDDPRAPAHYFPNKGYYVPMKFTEFPVSILGQNSFLDLCVLNFNGPRREVKIGFD